MATTTAHADGQKRGDLHRVRIMGSHPDEWGPLPYHQSLTRMKTYALRHGFPVTLDTVHEDGSVWRLGFKPNGQEPIDLGCVRQPAQREHGGMGAAWAPAAHLTPPASPHAPQAPVQTGPAGPGPGQVPARSRATHREVPGREDDPYRPRHGEAIRQPADNFGPDRKAESWSAPVTGVEEIEIPTAPAPTEQPPSRRARRDRERAAQQSTDPAADPAPETADPTLAERVGLPPLDAEQPSRLRAWASNLTAGSITAAGGGLAVAGAGVYFLVQTGVLTF